MLVQSIFISYASSDRDIADRVRQYLESVRIRVWIAHKDLTPGTANWDEAIRKAIASVNGVVLIATQDAVASQVVRGELDQAKKFGRPIYPLWAAGDDLPDAIPLDLGAHQFFDVRHESFDDGMRRLVDYFNGKVGPDERIHHKDIEYRRRMQSAERKRIFTEFRNRVKEIRDDKSKRSPQKLNDIALAGSTYVAAMAEFEKRWGDELLPAEDSLGKNLLVIISKLQRDLYNEESRWPGKIAAVIKHAAQLISELERHWGDDKGKTVEGSVVEQQLLDEAAQGEGSPAAKSGENGSASNAQC